MKKEPLTMRVRDLNMAAALISSGNPMLKNYRDEYNREYFVFIHTEKLDKAVHDYRADVLLVRAREYANNLKMLKGVIYAES